jgi:hypothetical protein
MIQMERKGQGADLGGELLGHEEVLDATWQAVLALVAAHVRRVRCTPNIIARDQQATRHTDAAYIIPKLSLL